MSRAYLGLCATSTNVYHRLVVVGYLISTKLNLGHTRIFLSIGRNG